MKAPLRFLMVVSISSQAADAASIIDVVSPFGGTKTGINSFGQTFTPSITGNLDTLRLRIASSAPSFTVTVWEFDETSGTLGSILGTKAIVSSAVQLNYSWAEVNFGGAIKQTAGIPMAFTIAGNEGFWGPAISDVSSYGGGAFFNYTGGNSVVLLDQDVQFETLVTPIPESSVSWMAIVSAALISWRSRKSDG